MRHITTEAEHIRHIQLLAAPWLERHELLAETYWDGGRGARWLVGERGTSTHLCEVIAGIFGSLVVHGDFDTTRFASYGDHADAFSRLLWMADCRDVGYYVAQKATIGMGRVGDSHEYSEEVARAELAEHAADHEAQGDGRTASVLRDAHAYTETKEMLAEHLGTHEPELLEVRWGEVLRPHVIISWMVLNKLAWLLRLKYGMQGPPECLKETKNGRPLSV